MNTLQTRTAKLRLNSLIDSMVVRNGVQIHKFQLRKEADGLVWDYCRVCGSLRRKAKNVPWVKAGLNKINPISIDDYTSKDVGRDYLDKIMKAEIERLK